jgi:hypothetical protein
MLNSHAESDSVYGAIYSFRTDHKDYLDGFEGKGHGYLDNRIEIQHGEHQYSCLTYLAQQSHISKEIKPYHWYKQLVVLGARYLQFPDAYISSIESSESIEDPNVARRKENEELIERIIRYC